MSFVAHVVEFLLIVGIFVAAGVAVAFFVARGYVRRHWRLVRGHPVTRAALASTSVLAAGRDRLAARATPEEQSRGSAARVRRRMWVAVEDAERAVAHADAREAPVAELPAVCRSLHALAGELDALLRHERRLPTGSPGTDQVRRQVAEVIAASRDVQAAALRAGSDATEPQVRALVRRATDEVEIVSAALARMRSVAQPR